MQEKQEVPLQQLDSQCAFVQQYAEQAFEGRSLNQGETEEMESVLYSISNGRQEFHKKVGYQAFSAAISDQSHVDLVLSYICQRDKIRQAKCKLAAYRISQQPEEPTTRRSHKDQDSQISPDLEDHSIDQQSEDPLLTEGFDDGGEEGCGQKLLHLLQKMGVENILIIVCVWHYGMPGQYGTDTYRMVIERAKDLLTTLHMKVLDAEKVQQEQLKMQQLVPFQSEKSGSLRASKNQKRMGGQSTMGGSEVTTKVYPSTVIPNKKDIRSNNLNKNNYRPNNFMSDTGSYKGGKQGYLGAQTIDDEEEQLEIELTEDEFNYAVKMTEHSIRRLTKGHIIELRNQVKPHLLVEKVMSMICILRGCIAPSWTLAREMMSSMTFKMELMLMDVCQVKQSLIKRIIKILNAYQKQLTPDNLSQISEGAAILLTWIINLIKWNAGHTKYKFNDSSLAGHRVMNNALMVRPEDHLEDKEDEETNVMEEQNEKDNSYGIQKSAINQENNLKQLKSQKSRKANGAHLNNQNQANKVGAYIQSKQMVFGTDRKLQPHQDLSNNKGSPYIQHNLQSSKVPKKSDQSLQHELVNQYQANAQQPDENQQMQDMIHMLQTDQKNNFEGLRQQIPEDEEEILRFLDTATLEEQPTEILVQLAQKLKQRRTKLYQDGGVASNITIGANEQFKDATDTHF